MRIRTHKKNNNIKKIFSQPGAHVLGFVPGSGMDFLKKENSIEIPESGTGGENLRFVAGESHGEGVSRARCHLLDVVLVLGARCECRHPPRSGLYRSVDYSVYS